jgi:Na+/H+ antiporter NhaA
LIAGAGAIGILVLQRFAVRNPLVYLVPAFVIWAGMLRSGIHPTIGGVVVGLMTPRGVGLKGLIVVGMVAGIGFMMSLFVAELAFEEPGTLGVAKLAVLVGSGLSAVLGLAVGWLLLRRDARVGGQAEGPSEAEASTEA